MSDAEVDAPGRDDRLADDFAPLQLDDLVGRRTPHAARWASTVWHRVGAEIDTSNSTASTAVIAAWLACLSRLVGKTRFGVGWIADPVARASGADIAPRSIVALGLHLDPAGDFAAACRHVGQAIEEAKGLATVPCPPPWPGHLDIAVCASTASLAELAVPGAVATLQVHGESSMFRLIYDEQRVSRSRVTRLARYTSCLLRDAASNRPLGRLRMLPPAERRLVIERNNRTDADFPRHLGVHQVFEAQAKRTPAALAIVAGRRSLTYAELDEHSTRLAQRLAASGAASGDAVVVMMERSIALVVAQLAVLKAGGLYVPIDPALPAARSTWLVADSRAVCSITCREDVDDFSSAFEITPRGATGERDVDPSPSVCGERGAYVMYTSGSTGTPKGVVVPHRAIVRLVVHAGYAQFAAGDRFAFVANPSFDASTLEVWAPLLNGGTIVVIDRDTLLSPPLFAKALRTERVDMLLLTSGLFSQIHRDLGAAIGHLKLLFVGGDTLNPQAIADVLRHHPPQRLLNVYGPTEAAVLVTAYAIPPDSNGATAIPIGRPISNTRIYLLDEHGEPVPLGSVGEMHVGGAGVALGYLNRPELTAERFLPDPFVSEPNARMYRTGDLARYRVDGNLEFLGRKDSQIKIRGFRIEPAEIEARLLECPHVREASVIVRDDDATGRKLVAYVVATQPLDRAQLIAGMHAFLGAQLPDFMVPSAFVVLDALPLTSTGKIDRRSLPPPDADLHVSSAYAPPREGMESVLADIWAKLLGVGRIGRDDNFFHLGGHSLLAMRLGSRLRRELGVTPPVSTLFSHPTLAAFAAKVEGLERSGLPSIQAAGRHEPILPSFAQQRLWFIAQIEAHHAAYHVPVAWRLRGNLDRAALRESLNRLIMRHEALRAVFISVAGQPRVRLLAADAGLPLIEHDLRGEGHRAARLQSSMTEEVHARFDLANEPPIRARLIRLDEDEHVLIVTLHHIATDGWSMKPLLRDMGSFYGARRGGGDDQPALPGIQYFDYAAWQHQWLTEAYLKPQLDYWRETLLDCPSLLQLPTDRPRPARQSFEGASLPVRIDAACTQALKQFARRHGCTPFVVLLAAWASILGRLSGQHDLVIGIPMANRQDVDVEPLIGFFVNSLPLRVDLSGDPDGATLIARVHDLALAAHEHADAPFERIVEVAQPVRRPDCTPLFQVMFAWQGDDVVPLELPGLHVEPIDTGYDAARFDLELDLAEGVDGIAGRLRYATALFDASTIDRYRGYFVTLLQAMIADEARPIARINLISEAERTLQIDTWNANETPFPARLCIHQLYEAQARRTPDVTAILHGTRTFAFGEINVLANRMAHRLIAQGVRPGERVFIVLERGMPLVVAELAILKVGAAYVPANAQTPVGRLAWMIEDSAAVLVLTDDGVAIPGTIAPTFAVDALMAEGVDTDPELALSAELPAYVMYTSGSTGTPKGVLIPHRGINRLAIDNTFAPYAPGDRVSFCSNPAFDASALDLWPTLLNGATVVVIDQTTLLSAELLVAALKSARVDILWLTIGLFNQMAAALAPVFPQFKAVMTGGDVLDPSKMADVLNGTPPQRLIAAYGPTETSVFTTTYLIDKADPTRPVPIGRPISNTRIYLLDTFGQPVPIGAPGEIFIGGAAVGLGYLNRPELTAERFLDDPFVGVAGARMYRSGDFGRYRADGNIEFLRRTDGQVKLRGFRVELGEIEMRLTEHPDVESAAVIVREETPGDKLLTAYLTTTPSARPHGLAARLRAYLDELLPDYMVPSSYVRLDELPLTPNGKLDRRALPAPSEDDFARELHVAPQGDVEPVLATLWAALLHVERVGRFDNFFALGGHSLLAVKIISQINAQFHARLTIDAIFNAPTVMQLAALIETGNAADSTTRRFSTPIPRVGRRRDA